MVASFRTDMSAKEAVNAIEYLAYSLPARFRLRASALVRKDAQGHTQRLQRSKLRRSRASFGIECGALFGFLTWAAAGPSDRLSLVLVLIAGATIGAILGITSDLVRTGLDSDLLQSVEQEMSPGTTALIAQVIEQSPHAVDSIVLQSGGWIYRHATEPLA